MLRLLLDPFVRQKSFPSVTAVTTELLVLLVICLYMRTPVSLYIGSLAVFHLMEYYCTSRNHPDTSVHAFLLGHSVSYWLAHLSSIVEYCIWTTYYEPVNAYPALILVGMSQALRSASMVQAGSNFTHLIKSDDDSKDGHRLVTTGVYAYIRHPSYAAFIAWTTSLHLLLVYNPVTMVLHWILLYKFFSERIYEEEEWLSKTFGIRYKVYKQKTWSGVPFVR